MIRPRRFLSPFGFGVAMLVWLSAAGPAPAQQPPQPQQQAQQTDARRAQLAAIARADGVLRAPRAAAAVTLLSPIVSQTGRFSFFDFPGWLQRAIDGENEFVEGLRFARRPIVLGRQSGKRTLLSPNSSAIAISYLAARFLVRKEIEIQFRIPLDRAHVARGAR